METGSRHVIDGCSHPARRPNDTVNKLKTRMKRKRTKKHESFTRNIELKPTGNFMDRVQAIRAFSCVFVSFAQSLVGAGPA
jgi:hypothetical protein